MSVRLRRALDQFIQGAEQRRLIHGVLGRINSDASITYAVAERPDFVHVRVGTESGSLTPSIARNTGRGRVPLRPNLPILMERKNGVLVIVGEDYDSGLLENDSGSTGNDYGVTPHPIAAHSDVTITAAAAGDILYHNGTDWVDEPLQERVEDFVAAQLVGNTGVINATYNDATGAITLTLDVSVADRILYSTAADTWAETALTAFARTLLDDADAATMRATLGITVYDAETTQDAVGTILVDGNGIDLTYNDATPSISAALTTLTSDWDIGEDRRILLEALRARDDEGIVFETDEGTDRLTIADDGTVTVNAGNFLIASANGRIIGITGLAAGHTVNFQYGGDSENEIELTHGAGAIFKAFHGVTIQNDLVFNLASGPALTVKGDVDQDIQQWRDENGTLLGTLTSTGRLSHQAGSSGNDAALGGVLFVSTATIGNVGTGEDDLASYSVPASTLSVNNQSIWFEAHGTFAANTASKMLRVRFGSTLLAEIASSAVANVTEWSIRGRIYRTGAATQKAWVHLLTEQGGSVGDVAVKIATPTETLSGAITLKLTGQGTTTNDVVSESLIVGYDDNNT